MYSIAAVLPFPGACDWSSTGRDALQPRRALIVLGAFGFSAKSILIKLAYADGTQVDAITLMTLRMLMSLPFFLAVALWSRGAEGRRQDPGDWMALVVLGVLGYYIASLLDFMGLQTISAGLERLILFLYPTIGKAASKLSRPGPVCCAGRPVEI
jgi:drug/metabolite transporter (DMT)-like permease